MRHGKYLPYVFTLVGLSVIVVLVFFLRTHRHGSFKETATGLQYQVVSQGKGPAPQEGDILLINACCKNEKGAILFDTADQELPMALPYSEEAARKDGAFAEAVSMLQKGDSLIFKLSAEKLFGESPAYTTPQDGLKRDEKIFLHLQLQDIMTEEAHKKWETEHITMLQEKKQQKDALQLAEDTKMIANYLKKNEITPQITSSGLCYVIDAPGRGAQPKHGDSVKVNYTGRLMDGKVFDTSLEDTAKQHGIHNPGKIYEAIAFQVGVGQVIQGWDEGIMCLHQGSKARLFIPSMLAYGSQSMGNGLIPANAILIFDVELLEVKGQ
jgi:FKBP-type peptidyl-prolyl cis-trans isomerase FkpA